MNTHDRKKEIKKKKNNTMVEHQGKPKRSANGVGTAKSRIKEMGPICKSRKKYEKDSPAKKQEDDDEGFVWLFNQVNQQEPLWLSSESLSPLYKLGGDFMFTSPHDYSVDERLISFLSSYRGISLFDRKENDAESWLMDPLESTIVSSCEVSSCLDSSSGALSTCSDSSSMFWDLDRTDMWVSLINLDGEDCKWISNVELDSENIESNFPSPTYKNKRSLDVHSFDVDADVSSSMRSFHDELSSELLSGSLDLDDMDFDEPLMWPFEDKYDSRYTLDFFCQSPRRGLGSSTTLLMNEGRRAHSKFAGFNRGSRRIVIASRNTKLNRSSRNSMKMMLSVSGSKLGKKHKLGKGNLVISAKRLQAMSSVSTDEFSWWPCVGSGSSTTTKSQSQSDSSSMDCDSTDLWVSLINLNGEESQWISGIETDWEEGFKSNFPSPSYKNKKDQVFWSSQTGGSLFQDDLSLEILFDESDSDEPLFWPYAKDHNWSMEWDSFCTSPRKGIFRNPTSIRVRIHDQRSGFKRILTSVSGLSASKIKGFKRGCGHKGNARRVKGVNSTFGRSGARKLPKNVGEMMEVIIENDVEGVVQVEKALGLQEFDGHEGLDMEFHTESFSVLEE